VEPVVVNASGSDNVADMQRLALSTDASATAAAAADADDDDDARASTRSTQLVRQYSVY